MKIFWKNGFTLSKVEGAIEIDESLWRELLQKQSEGYKIVTSSDGTPEAVEYEHDKTEELRSELRNKYRELAASDYKIIKCYEFQLIDQQSPYDIETLHREREALRIMINNLRQQLN